MMIKVNGKCYGVKLLQSDNIDHNKIFTLIGFYSIKDLKEVAKYIIDVDSTFKKISLIQLHKNITLKFQHYNETEQVNFLKNLVIDLKEDDKYSLD